MHSAALSLYSPVSYPNNIDLLMLMLMDAQSDAKKVDIVVI
jgi:hypothetical protein